MSGPPGAGQTPYARELAAAAAAVAEASALARSVQARIAASGERMTKADRSPVTVADLAAQAVISVRLAAAFPEVPLMAEEGSSELRDPANATLAAEVLALARTALPGLDRAGLEAALERGGHGGGPRGRFWVLDPVDGTRGFLRGEQFAVALALVEDGDPVLGVLGLPNLPLRPGDPSGPRGVLVTAVRGAGAWIRPLSGGQPSPIRTSDVADPAAGSFCESVERAHSSHGLTARIAARLGLTAPPYRVDGQTKYAIVARGEASIYLRLPSRPGYREKVWDHAAGTVIVTEAGGRVTDIHGRPLDLGRGRDLGETGGIVVTNGPLHAAVLAAVRAELATG